MIRRIDGNGSAFLLETLGTDLPTFFREKDKVVPTRLPSFFVIIVVLLAVVLVVILPPERKLLRVPAFLDLGYR